MILNKCFFDPSPPVEDWASRAAAGRICRLQFPQCLWHGYARIAPGCLLFAGNAALCSLRDGLFRRFRRCIGLNRRCCAFDRFSIMTHIRFWSQSGIFADHMITCNTTSWLRQSYQHTDESRRIRAHTNRDKRMHCQHIWARKHGQRTPP